MFVKIKYECLDTRMRTGSLLYSAHLAPNAFLRLHGAKSSGRFN